MIDGDINASLGSAELVTAWVAGVLFFAIGIAVVWIVSKRVLGHPRYGLTVFLGMFATGAVITSLFGPFFLAADGPQYDLQAFQFAQSLKGESVEVQFAGGKEGWPVVLGLVYFLFGRVTFVGIIISCIAVAISAIFVSGSAELLAGRFSERALYMWYFLTPLILLLGPSLMREALCWMAVSMVSYGVIARSSGHTRGLLVALLGALILGAVRTSLAVLVIAGLAVSWVCLILISRKMYYVLAAIAIAVAALASILLSPTLGALDSAEASLQANRLYLSAEATTGFSTSVLGTGVGGFLVVVMEVFPRVLLGPFPWELGIPWEAGESMVWLWVLSNSLIWLALLWVVLRKRRLLKHRRAAALILGATAIVMLGMSLSLTNYGIIVRMRGTPMIMLLPLALMLAPEGHESVRGYFRRMMSMTGAPQTVPTSR